MVVKIIVLSGHFGSGKTTLLLKLLELLAKNKQRVGVLINDVGSVDFELVASKANCSVENVSKQCLCIKGLELEKALKRLLESEVDVILTEAIGLSDPYRVWTTIAGHVSTLNYAFELNPITVLIDGDFFLKLHRSATPTSLTLATEQLAQWIAPEHFLKAINNVILQQLSEAELVVVNKCDLIPNSSQALIEELIREINNEAKVHLVSATLGSGIENFFSNLMEMKWHPRPPQTRPEIAKRRIEALSNMQWFTYEVKLELQRETIAPNLIKDILIRSLNETSKKIKSEGQIIRVKAYFDYPPNRFYASITPDLKMDLHPHQRELKVKNGNFTISLVVKNIKEEDVFNALNAALSEITSKFSVS